MNLNSEKIEKEKETNKIKKAVKEMLMLIKEDKGVYIFSIILRIISICINLYSSVLLGKLVEIITSKRYDEFMPQLIYLFCIQFLGIILSTSGILKIAKITEKIMYELRGKLNKHVQKLDIPTFEKNKIGNMIALFINDIPKIAIVIDQSIANVILSIIEILLSIIAIIYLNYILGGITLVLVTIIVYLVFKLGIVIKKYSDEKMKAVASVNSYAEEIVSNQNFVKLYNYEKEAEKIFYKKTDELKKYNITVMLYSNFLAFISSGGTNLLTAIMIAMGSYLSFKGSLSVASLTIIIRIVSGIINPIRSVSTHLSNIYEVSASSERVSTALELEEEIDDGHIYLKDKLIKDKNGKTCGKIKCWYDPTIRKYTELIGRIEFKDVDYTYNKVKNNIDEIKDYFSLKNINFKIDKNETLAIVGKTGAGKSTIINLITRFYEINKGYIYIDGIDIRKIKKRDLRSIISMVIQDINLFSGTILENVRYGNLNISEEEVDCISKKLGIDKIIAKLPEGLNTVINTEENSMSEGEKQIISILRAAVSTPKILILDEATSKIDTMTEKAIQNGIDALKVDKINIVIAHRLSTIRNADKILVLDKGRIVEFGNHDELMNKKAIYYKMIKNSVSDFDLKS